jgi:hypothetical protein
MVKRLAITAAAAQPHLPLVPACTACCNQITYLSRRPLSIPHLRTCTVLCCKPIPVLQSSNTTHLDSDRGVPQPSVLPPLGPELPNQNTHHRYPNSAYTSRPRPPYLPRLSSNHSLTHPFSLILVVHLLHMPISPSPRLCTMILTTVHQYAQPPTTASSAPAHIPHTHTHIRTQPAPRRDER